MQELQRLDIENIDIPERKRAVDPQAVKALAASMDKIGLKTPITIRTDVEKGDAVLVAGLHRLEAAKSLGWEKIDCIVVDCDEIDAELWEISENLHRADLTKEQRDTQIRRYAELVKEREDRYDKLSQLSDGRKAGPQHQKGVAATVAKETGLSKRTIERVLADPKPASPPSSFPQDDHERSTKWRRAFERLWNDAPALVDKEWAKGWIDRPIMDSDPGDVPHFLRRTA